MQLIVIVLIAIIAFSSAFVPLTNRLTKVSVKSLKQTPGPTYWEGAYPPSSILGIGEKIPSGILGPLSVVFFVAGTYSIHESNILNQITVSTINPAYIAGYALVPISWGLHVAAWIQKQNGK